MPLVNLSVWDISCRGKVVERGRVLSRHRRVQVAPWPCPWWKGCHLGRAKGPSRNREVVIASGFVRTVVGIAGSWPTGRMNILNQGRNAVMVTRVVIVMHWRRDVIRKMVERMFSLREVCATSTSWNGVWKVGVAGVVDDAVVLNTVVAILLVVTIVREGNRNVLIVDIPRRS